MHDEILELIALNMLSLLPLFQKKLMKPPEDQVSQKGISHTHFHVLILLDEMGTHPTSEIGKKLGISKPNMTPLIDKLTDEGLVERQPDNSDRRIINISLTQRGKEFLSEQKKIIVRTLKFKLSSLPDEDLKSLLFSLENVRSIVSKINL